jgi:hypothetical protein
VDYDTACNNEYYYYKPEHKAIYNAIEKAVQIVHLPNFTSFLSKHLIKAAAKEAKRKKLSPKESLLQGMEAGKGMEKKMERER